MSSSPDGSQLRQSFALVLHAASVLLQIVEYNIVLLFRKTGQTHCSACPAHAPDTLGLCLVAWFQLGQALSVRRLRDWLSMPAAEPVPRNARCAS